MHRLAVVARAPKAHPQGQLQDIEIRLGPDEAGARGAAAGQLDERFGRAAQVRPHERPAQAPAVLRVDVADRADLPVDGHGLRSHVALVACGTDLDPAPALQRRIGIRTLPRERREPHEVAGLAIDADHARPLDRKLVGSAGLREDEHVALATGL